MLDRDDKRDQQDLIMPSPLSHLRQQPWWTDDLQPRPKWEEDVKTKPTYLANFDWSKSFWNLLNGLEIMKILAWKTPGVAKKVAQL